MLKLRITDYGKPLVKAKGKKIEDFDKIIEELKIKQNGRKR